MEPIKASWIRCADIAEETPFADALTADMFAEHVAKIEACPHPAFSLGDGIFIEIPGAEWAHGDYLLYLPKRHWMVRRNFRSHWYVDIGIFKPYADGVYGWTDLWLDVLVGHPPVSYHLLDADEFAAALREGRVSVTNAALAMDSLNDLLQCLRNNEFPTPEMEVADLLFEQYSAMLQSLDTNV